MTGDPFTTTITVIATSSPDCFWCGGLLFPAGPRLVCIDCATTFDTGQYRALSSPFQLPGTVAVVGL